MKPIDGLLFLLLLLSAPGLAAQTVSTVAGIIDVSGFQDGAVNNALFNNPHGLAIDEVGNLYVADRYNHLIRKISPSGQVTTVAGIPGVAGAADGPANEATFREPWALCVANDGGILVADTRNNKIRKIDTNGTVTTLAGTGAFGGQDGNTASASFGNPTGIAQQADGTIYVADHLTHLIRKVSTAGQVSTLAGKFDTPGAVDGSGNAARFFRPYGIALAPNGNIIVADEWNHKIRSVTPAGVVSTIAGTGAIGWRDGTHLEAEFNYPWDVEVAADGTIYVGDGYNYVIRKISPQQQVITYAGQPQEEGAEDGPALSASFEGPTSIVLNASDDVLFISDAYNHAIRRLDVPAVPQLSVINLLAVDTLCVDEVLPLLLSGVNTNQFDIFLNGEWWGNSINAQLTITDLPIGTHTIQASILLDNGEQIWSAPLRVTIINLPSASVLSPDGLELTPGGSLRLLANGARGYLWSTGAQTEEIVVTQPGIYTLLPNNGFCTGELLTVEVTLAPTPPITPAITIEPFIPSAFSPNNDGINDLLKVRGLPADYPIEFYVFDRWGKTLFFAQTPSYAWDGRCDGQSLVPDTYTFLLQYEKEGLLHQLSGFINLHY